MGDRTNITDARQHDAEQAAGVIEQAMRNEGLIDKDVRLMGEIIAEALDAAGFDVVLRADPDTSDEHKPCPHCNDEGVVCTLDGEIIGPCDCTSDDLFTEARRLLDAATTAPRSHRCPDGMVDDVISWACQHCGEWQRDYGPQTDCAAAPEPTMVHAPSRLIAALLERAVTAEADRDEAERRERTAVNLANYHRGVAREAGRRADAARPPAPTESTPDPPYQPVAGRPTMDLLDRGTDR